MKRYTPTVAGCVFALVGWGSAGCGRVTDDRTSGAAGAGNSSGGGTGSTAPITPTEAACATPRVAPTPLRRLNNFELEQTVRDLLGDVPAASLLSTLPALPEDPFGHPRLDSEASDGWIETQHRRAHALALGVSRDPKSVQALTGCPPQALDEACRDGFLEQFLTRAYRRPVSPEEHTEMTSAFDEGQRLGGDFASGLRAVLEVVLQTPDFLYVLELGDERAKGTGEPIALTSYEAATRLSYFLIGSAPDAELQKAAAADELRDASGIEAQARRLLATPGARKLVRSVYSQRLGLGRVAFEPNREQPNYTEEISGLMLSETEHFLDDVTFEGEGSFRGLLTEPSTWLNGPLAAFYGVAGVSGEAFRKVQLDPTRRAGILTQPSFLRASPRLIGRGLSVLNDFLCVELPVPPPDVPVLPPMELGPDATTRERMEAFTAAPECLSCHLDLNPLGFAFEHYDTLGLWRDTENGSPIDSSGELSQTDAQGPFNDAIELAQRIAESEDAKDCFIGQWLAFAYARNEAPEDACARQELAEAFAASDGNVVELLVGLARTDAFRYRSAQPGSDK